MEYNLDPDNLNVFDLDGTLIKVDSFVEVTKAMAGVLLRNNRYWPLFVLFGWSFLRKMRLISHLLFKKNVVRIFEEILKEQDKQNIVNEVFSNNINQRVFELMLKSDNCIISTASPYAYTSRMCFSKNVAVISSLMPGDLPDPLNFREGKVENIKAYFGTKDIHIVNCYTDSVNDQALIDLSVNAFMFSNGQLIKVK